MSLMVGDHVILGTPTGSGKSMVAIGMMFMALCSGKRAFYTAPIKALVSEKFFGLVNMLGRENVGMITGDSQINPQAPVICCTAEIIGGMIGKIVLIACTIPSLSPENILEIPPPFTFTLKS